MLPPSAAVASSPPLVPPALMSLVPAVSSPLMGGVPAGVALAAALGMSAAAVGLAPLAMTRRVPPSLPSLAGRSALPAA